MLRLKSLDESLAVSYPFPLPLGISWWHKKGDDILSLDRHLEELRKKHAEISAQITDAQKHQKGMCHLALRNLKKQRLQLKDQIARIVNGGADVVPLEALWEEDDGISYHGGAMPGGRMIESTPRQVRA